MGSQGSSAQWAAKQLAVVDHLHLAAPELAELRAAGVGEKQMAELYPRDIGSHAAGIANLIDSRPSAWRDLRRVFRGRDLHLNLRSHLLPEFSDAVAFEREAMELASILFDRRVTRLRVGEPTAIVLAICCVPLALMNWAQVSADLRAYWTPLEQPASKRGERAVREVERKIERYARYLLARGF